MKKYIILLLTTSLAFSVSMFGQDRPIKGQILDDSTGQGLSNVSITIAGTDKGTNTDETGHFSMLVPEGSLKKQCRISSVGYATQTVALKPDFIVRLKK